MGLQIALKLSEVTQYDKVLTTPLTFAATFNAIMNLGAIPELVDVDLNGLMDVRKANQKYDTYVCKVLPVHYSGALVDIGKLNHKFQVIEDCAHAFGADFKWRGAAQVFSFYANKNITSGEGGMILFQDKELCDQARVLSAQGLSRGAWARYGSGPLSRYSVETTGYKGNLPDILAAIGLTQLRRWPEMKERRGIVFKTYEKAFGSMPKGHSTHFYPLLIKERDKVREILHRKGIGTGIHYKPLHLEPAYEHLNYKKGDFPMAEKFGREELSLPVSSTMNKSDAERVVNIIKGVTK
jgi:dTDP-4-amino-4,6-dideoxygalactose transaminase